MTEDISDQILPSWEDIQDSRAWTYEESVVKEILNKTGMGARQLEVRDRTDSRRLTIEALIDTVGFPLYLRARNFSASAVYELGRMLRTRPTTTAVWKEHLALFDHIPPEYGVAGVAGLVFPCPGYGRFTVFHNREPAELGKNGQFLRVGRDRELYFLESLDSVLEALDSPNSW